MASITAEDIRNTEDQRISSYTLCTLIHTTHSQICYQHTGPVKSFSWLWPILTSLKNFQIFLFWWTDVVITPVVIHCLSSPWFQHHFWEQLYHIREVRTEHPLQWYENNIYMAALILLETPYTVCTAEIPLRREELSTISSNLQCKSYTIARQNSLKIISHYSQIFHTWC